jgi:hypothetical protein
MIAPPWLIALGLVVGLLVLIPARRLREVGLARGTVGLYAALLWGLAMLVAIRPGATRLVIPLLLLAYLAPFIAGPDLLGRFLRRGGDGPRPMKDVTPPDPPTLPPRQP